MLVHIGCPVNILQMMMVHKGHMNTWAGGTGAPATAPLLHAWWFVAPTGSSACGSCMHPSCHS
jgi:hypothetical protein